MAVLRPKKVDTNTIILLAAVLGLTVVFSTLSPHFLTLANARTILEMTSILAILAVGVHFLLVAGEIDISFVAVLELSAAVAARLSPGHAAVLIAAGMGAAILVGLVNGLLRTRVGIPSFLVTLASMVAVQGVVLIVTDYRAVLLQDQTIPEIFYGDWLWFVTTAVYWMFLVVGVGAFIGARTKFGRWVYATGGNERAARLQGIPTTRVKLVLFVVSSLMAALAGFILASRAVSARPLMGAGYFMPVIAAPILGGASLTGGEGSVLRTALACLVLSMITNGVTLLGLEPAYRDLFLGIVLVSALSVRALRR
jgi:ribose/xylose/arabinose/galactoside ABC-type transport system permease subunit